MALLDPANYAIVGDVHEQLALCTLARWQRERSQPSMVQRME